MEDKTNRPEKKFRSGPVTATIWRNTTRNEEGDEITYPTVSLEKNYKDSQGRWKSTKNLKLNDIPRARLVLEKAYEYLGLSDEE